MLWFCFVEQWAGGAESPGGPGTATWGGRASSSLTLVAEPQGRRGPEQGALVGWPFAAGTDCSGEVMGGGCSEWTDGCRGACEETAGPLGGQAGV